MAYETESVEHELKSYARTQADARNGLPREIGNHLTETDAQMIGRVSRNSTILFSQARHIECVQPFAKSA